MTSDNVVQLVYFYSYYRLFFSFTINVWTFGVIQLLSTYNSPNKNSNNSTTINIK